MHQLKGGQSSLSNWPYRGWSVYLHAPDSVLCAAPIRAARLSYFSVFYPASRTRPPINISSPSIVAPLFSSIVCAYSSSGSSTYSIRNKISSPGYPPYPWCSCHRPYTQYVSKRPAGGDVALDAGFSLCVDIHVVFSPTHTQNRVFLTNLFFHPFSSLFRLLSVYRSVSSFVLLPTTKHCSRSNGNLSGRFDDLLRLPVRYTAITILRRKTNTGAEIIAVGVVFFFKWRRLCLAIVYPL